jgi:hypothetical protein
LATFSSIPDARCPAPEYTSLYEGVLLLAWAVTASERGEMGLMVGRIGMGGMLEGPLAQVDRLPAGARVLPTKTSLPAWIGDGRGATFSLPTTGDAILELSDRPIRDFLNHDGLEVDVGVLSVESFEAR